MGETRKTTASKSRAPKSTTGASKEPVEKSANTEPTQAEQDAVKANVLGAFIASAKSERGFWRSGIKFERKKKTLLVVCEFDGELIEADVDGIKHDEVIYIGKEKAARIHREPNLVIEDVEL